MSRPSHPCLPLLLATLAPVLLGAQERGGYPAADHGGNYMHNFYIPPAPSSTPWYPAWHPVDETLKEATRLWPQAEDLASSYTSR